MDDLAQALKKFRSFTLPAGIPSAEAGERKRILVERTGEWELLLMIWGPRTITPIHDHNDSRCWMRLLAGKLKEEIYSGESPQLLTENHFTDNGSLFIEDERGFHRLRNDNESVSVSLHLYTKPLITSRFFDEEKKAWFISTLKTDGALNEFI